MQKLGQGQGFFNKLREKVNFQEGLETLFDPDSEFKKIMDKLRNEADDPVRSILLGENVSDKAKFPEGVTAGDKSAKELLKLASNNFNHKEYMMCAYYLNLFHGKMINVQNILLTFKINTDEVHKQFLFEGNEEFNKVKTPFLEDLRKKFEKSSNEQYLIIKEAGIADFFRYITDKRVRALSAWESRYPGKVKKLKTETKNLITKSEKLLETTIAVLKKMATARATRKPDDYIEQSKIIISRITVYHDEFKKYYEENIKGFLNTPEVQKELSTTKEEPFNIDDVSKRQDIDPKLQLNLTQPTIPESEQSISTNQTVPENTPYENILDIPNRQVSDKQPELTLDLPKPVVPVAKPTAPTTVIKLGPDGKPLPLTPPGKDKNKLDDGSQFIESLESMNNESPIILRSIIIKYANSIKNNNLDLYNKLITIVNSIEG